MADNTTVSGGLDIGTTKVAVMAGRRKADGSVEIIGVGQSPSTGVSKGAIQNISKTISAIRDAVSQAERTAGIRIDKVTVGIAGQYIRSVRQTDYITRENPQRVIDQSDIDRLTERVLKMPLSEHERIIDVLPQEYKVDAESGILEPVGMSGQRLEASFHVIIGQIAPLLNVKRCVEGAGLHLAGLKLEPIASGGATLTDEEKEAGVVLVDIGGGTTDMVVYRDNLVRYSAVIPYGGKMVTNDIKEACSILGRYAEKLKIQFGSTWPGANLDTDIVSIPVIQGLPAKEISMKSLSRVIYARMDEILDDINLEIANYRQIEPNKSLIGGVVITGGGALLKHLPQFVSFKTQMSCRVGSPNIYLAEENREYLTSPVYATCVGLVLAGLDERTAGEEPTVEEQMVQSSVDMLEKETVELPIDEVLSEMHLTTAETPQPSRETPQADDAPAEPVSQDPAPQPRPADSLQQTVSVRVESTDSPEADDAEAEKEAEKAPAPDPAGKTRKKDKKEWDKRLEETIIRFLKKIE